jgi:DNA-binding Lrp family transcriptional regulator
MKAYILITITSGQINQVVKELHKLNSVKEAFMTFGPYDAVAKVESKDINQLGKLISEEIQPIPGILETLTCMAVE